MGGRRQLHFLSRRPFPVLKLGEESARDLLSRFPRVSGTARAT
jgi:hypothetical protein